MPKSPPLGANPLDTDTETALRSMVRGEKPKANSCALTAPTSQTQPLRRTGVYLTDEEVEALRLRAFEERRTKTDIMRQAIRQYLGLR